MRLALQVADSLTGRACALGILIVMAAAAAAAQTPPPGSATPPPSKVLVRGRVFVDADMNGARGPQESAIGGVLVSDQRRWVRTQDDGAYALLESAGAGMPLSIVVPAGYRLDAPWYVPPYPPQPGGGVVETDFALWPGGLAENAPTSVLALVVPPLEDDADRATFTELVRSIVEGERPDVVLAWTAAASAGDSGTSAQRLTAALTGVGPPVRWVLPAKNGVDELYSPAFGPRRFVFGLGAQRYLTADADAFAAGAGVEVRQNLVSRVRDARAGVLAVAGETAAQSVAPLAEFDVKLVIGAGPALDELLEGKIRRVHVPPLWSAGDPDRNASFALVRVAADGAAECTLVLAPAPVAAADPQPPPDSAPSAAGGDAEAGAASRPAPGIDEVIDAHPLVRGSLKAALDAALGR
jgi:hypothetical protein